MVPTTSQPQRRSRDRNGSLPLPQGSSNPLKSIHLTVTLVGASPGQLQRLAAEKALAVEEKRGRRVSFVLEAATPEDALAKLRLLTGVIAPKP